MNALETQVGGSHYKDMAIQPMEYSMANGLDACQHTVIKYVTRFRKKGGIQDLEKARHVLDMLIEFERKAQAKVPVNDNAPACCDGGAQSLLRCAGCMECRVIFNPANPKHG